MSGQDDTGKLYYRIGEVSRLSGVKPYVLRYWEKEFRQIRPRKSGKGQRLYRRQDLDIILEIKRLLYEERYTLPGAKKALKGFPKEILEPADNKGRRPGLGKAIEELKSIRQMLAD